MGIFNTKIFYAESTILDYDSVLQCLLIISKYCSFLYKMYLRSTCKYLRDNIKIYEIPEHFYTYKLTNEILMKKVFQDIVVIYMKKTNGWLHYGPNHKYVRLTSNKECKSQISINIIKEMKRLKFLYTDNPLNVDINSNIKINEDKEILKCYLKSLGEEYIQSEHRVLINGDKLNVDIKPEIRSSISKARIKTYGRYGYKK